MIRMLALAAAALTLPASPAIAASDIDNRLTIVSACATEFDEYPLRDCIEQMEQAIADLDTWIEKHKHDDKAMRSLARCSGEQQRAGRYNYLGIAICISFERFWDDPVLTPQTANRIPASPDKSGADK